MNYKECDSISSITGYKSPLIIGYVSKPKSCQSFIYEEFCQKEFLIPSLLCLVKDQVINSAAICEAVIESHSLL